jgi:uncharacterized protein YjeT (DUF2065 family)
MAQNNNSLVLKVSLIVFSVLTLVYGIGYLFFPQSLVDLAGSGECSSGWLRWSGGVLISLGVGAILTFRHPEHQNVIVLTFALGTLLSGLSLFYNLLFEISGSTWFTALPAIVSLLNSALLWWGWFQAKDVLKI